MRGHSRVRRIECTKTAHANTPYVAVAVICRRDRASQPAGARSQPVGSSTRLTTWPAAAGSMRVWESWWPWSSRGSPRWPCSLLPAGCRSGLAGRSGCSGTA